MKMISAFDGVMADRLQIETEQWFFENMRERAKRGESVDLYTKNPLIPRPIPTWAIRGGKWFTVYGPNKSEPAGDVPRSFGCTPESST